MALLPINLGQLTTTAGTIAISQTVPTTITTITSANSFILIQNLSDTDMYLGISGFTPTGTSGILILKNGGLIRFDSTFLPTGEYKLITAGAAPAAAKSYIFAFN